MEEILNSVAVKTRVIDRVGRELEQLKSISVERN